MRLVHMRGLSVQLDEPAGSSDANSEVRLRPEDLLKDGTGIGQLWDATNMLCDYVEAHPDWLGSVDSVIELGAGLGIPGMLSASLGARSVVLSDYHPLVLARLRANLKANPLIAARCTVEEVAWGQLAEGGVRHNLLLGADLAISERAASLLAATATALAAQGGVFVYAHQARTLPPPLPPPPLPLLPLTDMFPPPMLQSQLVPPPAAFISRPEPTRFHFNHPLTVCRSDSR